MPPLKLSMDAVYAIYAGKRRFDGGLTASEGQWENDRIDSNRQEKNRRLPVWTPMAESKHYFWA